MSAVKNAKEQQPLDEFKCFYRIVKISSRRLK